MKNEIMNCLTWYANRVAETVQYKNWSDEFCRKEVCTATMDFLSELRKHIDLSKFTREEATELRFVKWTDDGDLYLIPLYLLPIIPIGTELTCISGENIVYDGHNIDDDIRFGCLAYGIHIPETAKEKQYVYEIMLRREPLGSSSYSTYSMDLCPECMKKLCNWLQKSEGEIEDET